MLSYCGGGGANAANTGNNNPNNPTGNPTGGSNNVIVSNFEELFSELHKMHTEAKDNVKFLTTLERHFKNL